MKQSQITKQLMRFMDDMFLLFRKQWRSSRKKKHAEYGSIQWYEMQVTNRCQLVG